MKQFIFLIVGTLLCALSTTLLAMPNGIADGGIIGISLLFYYAFNFSPGITTFIIFILLLGVSFKYLHKNIVYKTIVNVPLLSLFIFFTENWGRPVDDPLVAAIFAGLIMGVGFGLIIQAGSSIGGTSIIARILYQKFEISIVLSTFLLDTLIILMGVFIIGPVNTMYTIIALFVGKVSSDYVLSGFDAKKAVNIVSTESRVISDKITSEMGSSVTILNGSGGYKREEQRVIYVVVNNYRLLTLKKLIREIDANAFIVVHNVKDVSGGTFFAELIENQNDETTDTEAKDSLISMENKHNPQ